MKRFLTVLLAISIFFTAIPFSVIPVFAAESTNSGHKMHLVLSYADRRDEYDDDENTNAFGDDKDVENLHSVSVKLLADITTTRYPQFKNADVYIDLNGHTWTVTGAKSNFETIHNITIVGGTMIFKNSPSRPISTTGGNIKIRNVIFKDSACGEYGLISCKGGVKRTFYGISWNTTVLPGSVLLDNVRFENCSSASYGGCVNVGCVNVKAGEFNNCKFNNCHSQYGGAVYVDGEGCECSFTNCEFNECYATTDGGALYTEKEKSVLKFTNCNAYRCHADDDGGFIAVCSNNSDINGAKDKSTSTLADRSNIVGCYSKDSGGAVYCNGSGCEIKNFNIVSNTSGADVHNFETVKSIDSNSWGGGICMQNSDIHIKYCDFYDNYASRYGGAIYAGWKNSSIENCTFYENRCQDYYKANDIYLDSSNGIDIISCSFLTSENSVGGKNPRANTNNNTTYTGGEASGNIEDGDYILYTALSPYNYCVCLAGDGYSNGENVHLFSASKASALVYTITKDKNKGTYVIKSKYSGYTLDVVDGSKANGANIRQLTDNGSDAQRWTFEPSGDGYYYIKNVMGQYMDVSGGVAGDRVNIHSWGFTGANNQKWKLVRVVDEGDYIIRSALDDRYALDINGGADAVNNAGANAHLWENGASEVFTLTKNGKLGRYTLKSKATGLVLDIEGDTSANGANIYQWTNYGNNNQIWSFEAAGDGYYYIRSGLGTYVDVAEMVDGKKPFNGVNVYSWGFTGGTNQKFRLERQVNEPEYESIKVENVARSKNIGDGKGTKDDPYIISNAGQWKIFALNVIGGETYEGKYIELANDISISYVPVGCYNQQKAFKGHFDGKNHTVHYLDSSEKWDRALFSYCHNATIKNVRVTGKIIGSINLAGICVSAQDTTFENCTNDADVTSISEKYVAGICAIAGYCKFISCTNNGTLRSVNHIVGGIAAYSAGDTQLTGCRNNGSLYTTLNNAGGMVGEALDHVTIKRCTNNGRVEAACYSAAGMIGCLRKGADIISCVNTEKGYLLTNEFSASMIGWTDVSSEKITITNCANYAEVTANTAGCAGIVVNYNNSNMTVDNCFTVTKGRKYITNCGALATSNTKGTFNSCYAEGSAFGDNRVTVLNNKECGDYLATKMNIRIGELRTVDNEEDFAMWHTNPDTGYATPDLQGVFKSHITGKGTKARPFLISDVTGLKELANNIKIGIDYNGKYIRLQDSFLYTGSPIGNDEHPFRGIFDGNGHTITVQINSSGSCTALFASASGATIKNLCVAGFISGKGSTAGIAGYAYSDTHIDNCHVTAAINGTEENVGGIVGMTGDCIISNCRMDGPVTSSGWTSTGGIVGGTTGNCKIINCVSGSTVTGSKAVGGIIGCALYHNPVIINCSSIGATAEYTEGSGDEHGGIIGYVGGDINSLTINACYSKCAVAVSSNSGYFVGNNDKGAELKIDNSYYTKAGSAGQIVGGKAATKGTVTAVTSLKLASTATTLTNYANGKTEGNVALTPWTKESSYLLPTSYVKVESAEPLQGKGTKLNPFRISGKENLMEIAEEVSSGGTYTGKYITVTRDIDYTGCPQIGNSDHPFKGTFNGGGYNIKVDINTGNTCAALFYETDGATIKNIKLSGSVSGSNCVAGIVGNAYGGTVIDNCFVNACISGTAENCGGVAGMMYDSTISNCRVEGTVTSGDELTPEGGISEGDYIINLQSTAYSVEVYGGKDAVNTEGANVDLWMDGENEVFTITRDKAKGTYIIKSRATGLVLGVENGSKNDGANIKQWVDNGSDDKRWVFEPAGYTGYYYIRCVGGQYMDAAGLAGNSQPYNGLNIQSSRLTGASNQQFKLEAVSYVLPAVSIGGIVGWMHHSCKVINCVKTGETKGHKYVGGIAGFVQTGDNVIANCSSVGSLASTGKVVGMFSGQGRYFGGIVGEISSDVNTLTLVSCFSDCKMPSTSVPWGYIFGHNGLSLGQVTEEHNGVRFSTGAQHITYGNLYYIETDKSLGEFALGSGVPIPLTKVWKQDRDQMVDAYGNSVKIPAGFVGNSEGLDKLNEFVKNNRNLVEGVPLTNWTRDGFDFYPGSFVDGSSFIASVFSTQNLPILIVIVTGLVAGGVGVAVMYRKRRKKSE